MKLWEGRFEGALDEIADRFNRSIEFDSRMFKEDIQGSIAHVKMLEKIGVLTEKEWKLLDSGLNQIRADILSGDLEIDLKSEDIHSFIEEVLTERLGEVGKKLHTGRSRNDQVAVDLKLYSKNMAKEIENALMDLIKVILEISKKHTKTLMPGYTHLQNAQVVTFAHHMMAYGQMLHRDLQRLNDAVERMDYSPLGSGALATTTYPLDRFFAAELLGFKGPTENSMDSVADRDYVAEMNFVISLIMAHLSKLSEELIIWSSQEFKFVEISDAYSTGSSIMPQKKNPDMAELIRGKTGRVYGNLMAILTVIKGTPMTYNKDYQEDKEGFFDSIDTVIFSLKVMASMIETMTVNEDKMRESSKKGFLNATDLADYLVGKNMAFRDAYKIVGEIVLECQKQDKTLEDLDLKSYKKYSEVFENDLYEFIDLDNCLNKRKVYGGPAPECVEIQIKNLEEIIVDLT
ncbi:MAG: argininosuccinate lyase [Tissierellia bacterium]|nr:argininosuccinate lyase [Tissierellia bacterium]